jgi:hypothetical protein
MSAKVIRFSDHNRKSREPDAVDRDPAEHNVIILPVVRVERYVPQGVDIYEALAGSDAYDVGFCWPMLQPY